MASYEESWFGDIINDFIHSSIWLSPIRTFIDENCACFDYDDDDDGGGIEPPRSSLGEQRHIYKRYQHLVNSLITSLSEDLKLDIDELKNCYQQNHSITTDESYEQLYSTNDFRLFIEMMKRKNLILQLQALVNLQLEYGLLKQTDTNDDRLLQLLLQATSSPARQVPVNKPPKVLSTVKHKDNKEMNTDWHRPIQTKENKGNNEPKTIDAVPDNVLREKLRELSIGTTSSDHDDTAAAMVSRKNFLKQQRDLIINKQRDERARELEKETRNARPQSAVAVARKAMETTNKQEQLLSNDELEKRRAIAAKLRREVVDKQ